MVLFINAHSNNGNGLLKWKTIENDVRIQTGKNGQGLSVEEMTLDIKEAVCRHVNNGERVFVAAGGDGSVHMLLNALMKLPAGVRKDVKLGAIGLGSSNDFHKPMREGGIMRGVPVKIDFINCMPHNVAHAEYLDEHGNTRSEYFLINASIGIIAEGNDLFNRGDCVIDFLKHKWVQGTITWASIKTILSYKNFKAALLLNGERCETGISTLSIVINPHFTGNLRYDTPVTPQSVYMCVNMCENMGLMRILNTFSKLGKSIFTGLPGTRSWQTGEVEIIPEGMCAFEMDGEVRRTRHMKILLMHNGIQVCQ